MRLDAIVVAAAVPGLVRSDPHGTGITRVRETDGVSYGPAGAEITDARRWAGSGRCASRPPGRDVGSRRTREGHIQATGTDSPLRLQLPLTQARAGAGAKPEFGHMPPFAGAAAQVRTAGNSRPEGAPAADRDRVGPRVAG